MKILNQLRIYLAALALVSLFVGCSASGAIVNLSGNPEDATEQNGDLIELKNGTFINGHVKKIILSYSLNRGVKMDGQQYKYEDINAVQADNHYYRRFDKKNFVERIVKGKISVYRKSYAVQSTSSTGYTQTHNYYLYYLQKGDKANIEYWDLKTLNAMIADNSAATAAYSEYKAESAKEKNKHGANDLDNVIRIYNK